MLSSFDSMSSLQADIMQKGRTFGGLCTFCAYGIMFYILIAEVWNFILPRDFETTITLDQNSDKLLQINIDMTMHKIECKNLRLVVKNVFGDEPLNTLSNDFTYRPVQQDGKQVGKAYRESSQEELVTKTEIAKSAMNSELDSDWASSHDGFKHKSFKEVISGHDFIFANFFATWCPHCRHFAPKWDSIAKEINQKTFKDADGKQHRILFIKVNCVDFKNTCVSEDIDAYPTLRLYKKDGSWNEFEGNRELETIEAYVEKKVRTHHFGFDDSSMKNGCNIRGRLLVPRVPGLFAMEAGGATAAQGINAATANVSHTITHLSFSDPEEGIYHRKAWRGLPSWVSKFVSSMDSQSFITTALEQAPHHHVKIVSTQTTSKAKIYQFISTNREARVEPGQIPEMKVIYDLEPMAVQLSTGRKPWYDFLCTLLGIVGGIYVTIEGLVGVSSSVTKRFHRATTSSYSVRTATATSLLHEN
eukprot:GEMP01012818.1.p1 GENE.GEMP01012818.1~~GEMP01012818.1.p1  ORF type:complete len:474 (+),score=63.73 GEMP01012818.1:1191-2612(+)